MFTLSNLRKETINGWTYLKCDFDVTGNSPFEEKTMWVAVEEKNEDMLADNVYDPFVLVPVMLGMYYKHDVKIEGNISPRLYHNLTHYLMKIFHNFSDHTEFINFSVNGFDTVKGGPSNLIGTGISCGVDSLSTIYDNFIMTEDPNFRINSLFFANTGTHGDYENENSRKIFFDRVKMNKNAADELGLPMYLIDSNFHAFTHKWGEQKIGYLAMYSCFISLQKYIKRYITSSALSYDEIAQFYKQNKDFDMSEYCESYMTHLISTERFELVIDGCQYTREEKTERISTWNFAQKHLNVCVSPLSDGSNCSKCTKCMRTLIPLEVMGKLNDFQYVFDLKVYHKNSYRWKLIFRYLTGKNAYASSVVKYVKQGGGSVKFPYKPTAWIYINMIVRPKALYYVLKNKLCR